MKLQNVVFQQIRFHIIKQQTSAESSQNSVKNKIFPQRNMYQELMKEDQINENLFTDMLKHAALTECFDSLNFI